MKGIFFLPIGLLFTFVSYAQEPEPKPKTIPEIVKEEGSFSGGAIGDSFYGMEFANAPPDLAKLISRSELIVKGVVLEAKPHLSQNQREILTDNKIGIQEVFYSKHLDPVPQTVQMCLLGGKMRFPEGWAEYHDSDYPNSAHPIPGQTFILFLGKSDQHQDTLAPIDIGLGVFRVEDGKVLPATPEREPLHRKFKGTDVLVFIDEIKAAVGVPPNCRNDSTAASCTWKVDASHFTIAFFNEKQPWMWTGSDQERTSAHELGHFHGLARAYQSPSCTDEGTLMLINATYSYATSPTKSESDKPESIYIGSFQGGSSGGANSDHNPTPTVLKSLSPIPYPLSLIPYSLAPDTSVTSATAAGLHTHADLSGSRGSNCPRAPRQSVGSVPSRYPIPRA